MVASTTPTSNRSASCWRRPPSLIEAAAAAREGRVISPFVNLLVNPAFEAARYLPVFEQMEDDAHFVENKPLVFVAVTARNDLATGLAFPIGESLGSLGESVRGWRQRQALIETMGHLSWMRTHDLSAPGVQIRRCARPIRPRRPAAGVPIS
jgi:hypothetical protein